KLKPNEEQIKLAKQIWQTTADELRTREQLEILQQRISLKRLPPKTDKIINQLLDDNQKKHFQILFLMKINVLVSHHVVQKQSYNVNLI
ncbi:unnamed protein product, partial [Adineta steineri]